MAMLPFALSIFVFTKYKIEKKLISYLAIGVFVWNMCLGLVPYHFLVINSDVPMTNYIARNPNGFYYLNDKATVLNLLRYYYPDTTYNITATGPANPEDEKRMEEWIESGKTVLTNIIKTTIPISRGKMLSSTNPDYLKSKYTLLEADRIEYDLGVLYITQMSRKE